MTASSPAPDSEAKNTSEHPKLGVHLSHCNFGEHAVSCKYGDDDCPALSDSWSWFGDRLQQAQRIIDRAVMKRGLDSAGEGGVTAAQLRTLGLSFVTHHDVEEGDEFRTHCVFKDTSGMSFSGSGTTDAQAFEQVHAAWLKHTGGKLWRNAAD